jgi:hypothetical protein
MRIRLLGGFAIHVDGRDAGARPWRLRKARTVVVEASLVLAGILFITIP